MSDLSFGASEDEYTFEPVLREAGSTTQVLSFSRASGKMSFNTARPAAPLRQVRCIMGVIQLNAGPYLMLVTESQRLHALQMDAQRPHDVFLVKKVEIVRVRKDVSKVSATQLEDDRKYVALLHDLLSVGRFYYSATFDLTTSLQAQNKLPRDAKIPMYKRADARFNWTAHLQRQLVDICESDGADPAIFVVPMILGFVAATRLTSNNRTFDYLLITRRSVRRAGTRYFTRGADLEGNVANFNETEQIVQLDNGERMSYVQTRGSMPMLWRQIVNLKYTPLLEIDKDESSVQAFDLHFRDQVARYGDQIIVNLINRKGYEHRLGEYLQALVDRASNGHLRYEPFDFHKECSKMRWDRLSLLLDKLEDALTLQAYFSVDYSGKPLTTQKSVVRTNCMDCLDRTNVVQSLLARRALRHFLVSRQVLDPKAQISDVPSMERALRTIWADNADAVSVTYSGTGALKTDFTRTGKRTRQGALQDGVNSAVRYVRNNFWDGTRQDAFDLFLGNYTVIPGMPSPFAASYSAELPLLLLISLVMFVASILYPANGDSLRYGFLLFWIVVIAVTARAIFQSGRDFVQRPRLFEPLSGRSRPIISTY